MKRDPHTFQLAVTAIAGVSLCLSCDKKEPAAGPPSGSPAPVASAGTMSVPPDTTSPGDTPVSSPDAALESFKAEIKSIKAFMEANQNASDPTSGLTNLRELVKRAAAVSTEGLPADLSAAYQDMTSVMQRVQLTLDDLPVPVDKLDAYMKQEALKGQAAASEVAAKLTSFQTSMSGLQKDGETAAAKLKLVGAKYGVESFEIGQK